MYAEECERKQDEVSAQLRRLKVFFWKALFFCDPQVVLFRKIKTGPPRVLHIFYLYCSQSDILYK